MNGSFLLRESVKMRRSYDTISVPTTGDRWARMGALVDALWAAFGGGTAREGRGGGAGGGYSWVGFYLGPGERMDDGRVVGAEEMLLGPRRDKPACSPIGLHGACGRAWRLRTALVVPDVRALGAEYVACDPRDMAEVVLPCFDERGGCWGVLDVDSFEVGAFTRGDAEQLGALLVRAGLSAYAAEIVEIC